MDRLFEKTRTEISFRDIMEFAPIGILIFQKDWRIRYVNRSFFQFRGIIKSDQESIIGQSIYELELFEGIDLRDELDMVKKGDSFERAIATSKTLSGGNFSIILKGTPIFSDDESNGGLLIIEDLKSDASSSKLSLLQSPDFQSFLFLLSDYFLVSDVSGNVKYSPMIGGDLYNFLFEAESLQGFNQSKKISPLLFRNLLEKVFETSKQAVIKIPNLRDGVEVQSRITLIPFSENGIETEWVIFLVKDLVNEWDEVNENELLELSKFALITNTFIDALIGINTQGKISFWNESATKHFGLTKSEVYGKFIGKIFPTFNEEKIADILLQLKESKSVEEKIQIGADEGIAEYFNIKIGMLDESADPIIFLVCTDITEAEKNEISLKKSEERFRNIVTNSHDYICTLNSRGRITYANPRFYEVFGYDSGEIHKLSFTDLIDSYYLINNSFTINSVFEEGIKTRELPLKTKNGQPIHVLASFSQIENPSEVSGFYNIILTDITFKKESEKDLMLIRSVFEASLDGIALISKRRFALINDAFVKMFGFKSASEMLGSSILNYVSEKDSEKLTNYLLKADAGEKFPSRFDFTAVRKDKSNIEIEASVTSYEIELEIFTVWVMRDVTEEKKASEILQISEERYRSISENINEFIWTAVNKEGKLVVDFYTPAVKKITSFTAEQFLDDPKLWRKIIHPDDSVEFISKLKNLYLDSARNYDSFEYRIIDALGNVLWIENRITLNRDITGNIQRIFGIVSDNTLSKRTEEELKKTAAKLKESNDTKDRFISIISHDLRTPFSSILGFTDMLASDPNMPVDKRNEYVQFIRESSKSMLSLVNSLLDWTRLQTGRIRFEPERINISNVISKSIQITSGSAIQKNIKLVSELNKDFFVHADESLMLQVFNNLVSNAIKFTKSGGNIRISAQANIEKRQIEFLVADDGIGIRKEDLNKLFTVDKKFTTSGTAGEKGSGLGLSLISEIVHKHGGEIWVNSELGKGTQFTFSIPVASTNLLLVDDSKTDRLLYSKLIKTLIPNYTILEAENGKHALDLIKQSSPALVITDHNMPVMSGYDLVKQINISELKFKPPVIILSSDVNSSIEAEYKNIGIEFIFQKPVNLTHFKSAIDSSLRKAFFN